MAYCCISVHAAPFAYVANERSGTVSIIDVATDAMVGDISAGKKPRGMTASIDGKRLFVSDQPASALQVVDIATRKITGKIDLGESPEGVYRSPDGKWLAVAVEDDNSVHFIDTATGKPDPTFGVNGKKGVARFLGAKTSGAKVVRCPGFPAACYARLGMTSGDAPVI